MNRIGVGRHGRERLDIALGYRLADSGAHVGRKVLEDRARIIGQSAGGAEPRGWTFAPGDKVMQRENDYDKEVHNGDIGYIDDVDPEAGELVAGFDGRSVTYGFGELDALVPPPMPPLSTRAMAPNIPRSPIGEDPLVSIGLGAAAEDQRAP